MQTSSKVTSAKKVGLLASLFGALQGTKAYTPVESMGGRGHYFDGNAELGYNARRSQSKRRKMERRTRG